VSWDFAAELRQFGPPPFAPSPAKGEGVSLSFARSYCAQVARTHYENFTVVSALLPRRLVPHFHAVYAYCRWADDLADETAGGQQALDLLAWWRAELLACYDGTPRHPVMVALRETITRFRIPPEPFLNLLVAFEQDQRQTSYPTFADLLGYCRHSADPVGHLVLYLFECFDTERAAHADQVCTGLQLANFWQDVARDCDKGRVYIPEEDRRQFGYTDADLHARRFTPAFAALMRFEVERTRGYFERGRKLLPLVPRRVRVDVELFIRGGEAILAAIERQGYDVWSRRPQVSKWVKAKLLAKAAVRHLVSG
jgi:squalene synthase HpnC